VSSIGRCLESVHEGEGDTPTVETSTMNATNSTNERKDKEDRYYTW